MLKPMYSIIVYSSDVFIRPENMKELFNLRHSSLRMEIERIFGVLKRRFKIIRTPPEYSIKTQVLLVLAITALHNYIAQCSSTAEFEDGLDDQPEVTDSDGLDTDDSNEQSTAQSVSADMDRFRDNIANRMWIDYQQRCARYR